MSDQVATNKHKFKNLYIWHGFSEAPRGALGHWIKIENQKIDSYQCVVPTTWNAGPRDDKGQ
ncbi:nickel-dependent hydrogenase large subunit, partial [Salmonella enterica subsp. enterica serovar Anatum]|nr:nickel-dependent hydrogenase large subunit [Salmonella enterica subsp. enterica serovar Anatum]